MSIDQIIAQIESQLGKVLTSQTISGGDINQAMKLETKEGQFFVKWNQGIYPQMFLLESIGLKVLERSGAIRVPKVIMVDESFLVLEWLDFGDRTPASAKKLGQSLARLHQKTSLYHGLEDDNFIGTLPQKNRQTEVWWAFYWEQRIKPQMQIAKNKGRLTEELEEAFWDLSDKLKEILPTKVEASLLHGDLWGGNWAVVSSGADKGKPVVFDPAIYCGHREVDIAMTELFGGFPAEFYQGYNQVWKLDKDYQHRKKIYQLYPLLVHLNLFGGGYADQIMTIIKSRLIAK